MPESLYPPPLDWDAVLDADRCRAEHAQLGRCGFVRGHGGTEPHDVAHGVCASLAPAQCRRWDDSGDWVEPPTPWGDMSRRRLPWAVGYLAGHHAAGR